MCESRNILIPQKTPRGQRIIVRCGKRMFRGKSVRDRKRPPSGGPADLSDHATMAHDGTRAITATMKKQQHARRITSRDNRPFCLQTADIHSLKLHVIGYRPNRTDLVETLPPFRPADRTRFGSQQCAYFVDLALSHWFVGLILSLLVP
jgi:hypothetical protein